MPLALSIIFCLLIFTLLVRGHVMVLDEILVCLFLFALTVAWMFGLRFLLLYAGEEMFQIPLLQMAQKLMCVAANGNNGHDG